MTGVGMAAGPTEFGELRIELRSVNGRGLAVKHRLCAECSMLEHLVEERVRATLARGSVTVNVEAGDELGLLGDVVTLRRTADRLRSVARTLGLSEEFTVRDVLQLAGSLPRHAGGTPETLPPAFIALLDTALAALVQRRRAEGAVLLPVMHGHLDELRHQLATAAARAPAVVTAHRERLQRRVGEVLAAQGLQLEAADLVREVALFAERIDVSEEVQRLHAHVGEVQAVLQKGGEVGRRLEFLLQEVLREANTLGSKSPDVTMSHAVVAMKSAIDKLKEQAANLE
jgi:uncharacterized protein (TIGR00255 family)